MGFGYTLISDGHKCQRRLHRGSFVWPKVNDKTFVVTQRQWEWLVAGVDWQRLSATCQPDWQV